MKNGPELWDRILAAARAVYGHDAVIAGGCVRDYLLGVEPKDIDVFVNVADGETLADGIEALKALALNLHPLEAAINEYEQAGLSELAGVLDGTFEITPADASSDDLFASLGECAQVQIIACPCPEPVQYSSWLVRRFDLGLTQCWYDGEIGQTEAALLDRSQRTMTLLRWDTETRVDRTRKRFDRINERLGGWTFVDPRQAVAA